MKILLRNEEVEKNELLEAVTNILDNEYLSISEKKIVKKLAVHYKIKLATSTDFTTEEIEHLQSILTNLYDKREDAILSEEMEIVKALEDEIQDVEIQLFEAHQELINEVEQMDEETYLALKSS